METNEETERERELRKGEQIKKLQELSLSEQFTELDLAMARQAIEEKHFKDSEERLVHISSAIAESQLPLAQKLNEEHSDKFKQLAQDYVDVVKEQREFEKLISAIAKTFKGKQKSVEVCTSGHYKIVLNSRGFRLKCRVQSQNMSYKYQLEMFLNSNSSTSLRAAGFTQIADDVEFVRTQLLLPEFESAVKEPTFYVPLPNLIPFGSSRIKLANKVKVEEGYLSFANDDDSRYIFLQSSRLTGFDIVTFIKFAQKIDELLPISATHAKKLIDTSKLLRSKLQQHFGYKLLMQKI